jgi:hypothetical protein
MKNKTKIFWIVGLCQIGTLPAVNEDLKPVYCSEQAVTHVNTAFNDEIKKALEDKLKKLAQDLIAGAKVEPDPKFKSDGLVSEKIDEAKKKAADWINSKLDEVEKDITAAVPKVMSALQEDIAKELPSIQFSGLYSYNKCDRSKGTWSGLAGVPIGPVKKQGSASINIVLAAGIAFGIEVTGDVGLEMSILGSLELLGTNATAVQVHPPSDGPVLSVSIPIIVAVTYGKSITAIVGVELGLATEETKNYPAGFVSGVLTAGKGDLLFPKKETVTYTPICK